MCQRPTRSGSVAAKAGATGGEQGEENKCECFKSVPGHHGPPIKEFKVHETGFKQEKPYHTPIAGGLLDAEKLFGQENKVAGFQPPQPRDEEKT